jgi:hypothetical protein
MNIYDRAAKNKQKVGRRTIILDSWLFELMWKGIYHGGADGTEKAEEH